VIWLRTMMSDFYQNNWVAGLTSQNANNAPALPSQ
jgi:hypothetical protein